MCAYIKGKYCMESEVQGLVTYAVDCLGAKGHEVAITLKIKGALNRAIKEGIRRGRIEKESQKEVCDD